MITRAAARDNRKELGSGKERGYLVMYDRSGLLHGRDIRNGGVVPSLMSEIWLDSERTRERNPESGLGLDMDRIRESTSVVASQSDARVFSSEKGDRKQQRGSLGHGLCDHMYLLGDGRGGR